MPQMAPIWWTMLFVLFNMSFIIMIMLMYFQINIKPTPNKQITDKITTYNWKW